jgi:hypothetical protein
MNEKLGPQTVNILTSVTGLQHGADRTHLMCERQQVILACRAETCRACIYHRNVTTELHFVWPPVDVNEDSSRLGYDTVLTSKCDVVCFRKILVDVKYWTFMTCTPHHTSFECSNQEDRDGQGM